MDSTDRIEMGRKSFSFIGLSIFGTGHTIATFQLFGKISLSIDEFIQRRLILRRQTTFIFSFCIRLVTKLNDSAFGVLKHHYITKRTRELLIGNSRFLIYNSLSQLLY